MPLEDEYDLRRSRAMILVFVLIDLDQDVDGDEHADEGLGLLGRRLLDRSSGHDASLSMLGFERGRSPAERGCTKKISMM